MPANRQGPMLINCRILEGRKGKESIPEEGSSFRKRELAHLGQTVDHGQYIHIAHGVVMTQNPAA